MYFLESHFGYQSQCYLLDQVFFLIYLNLISIIKYISHNREKEKMKYIAINRRNSIKI